MLMQMQEVCSLLKVEGYGHSFYSCECSEFSGRIIGLLLFLVLLVGLPLFFFFLAVFPQNFQPETNHYSRRIDP